jgi:hypothetical protein
VSRFGKIFIIVLFSLFSLHLFSICFPFVRQLCHDLERYFIFTIFSPFCFPFVS